MPLPTAQTARITPDQLRTAAGRVCVALSGPAVLQDAAATLPTCRFLEFRLDSIAKPAGLIAGLSAFLTAHPHVVAIATCRRTDFGGSFEGTAREQLRILEAAAQAGCRLIDAEVETAEELGQDLFSTLHAAGAAVMLSWHDFTGTPPLDPVFERLAALAPDFIKIVPTAQTLRDSLALIDLLQRHGGDGRLIAMGMGQPGVLTRVLGPRYGSAFTFAAPDGGAGTAPGQVNVTDLRELYRIESLSAKTAMYAVAGAPIGASLSPRMHNTALRAAGLDAVYLPLETADAEELHQVIDRFRIHGLSITMPLKEAVLPLLAHRSPEVIAMGACNTLLRQADGTFYGCNTDVAGIVGPLEQVLVLQGKRVLVLGAGGAARAAVFGLRERGAEVFLLNRTPERAAALAKESGAQVLLREHLTGRHFDVLINSTPYGMRGKQIAPPIEADEMRCDLFFDLVYNPLETPLMLAAKQRGIPTVPGAAMFVAQGVRQFEMWTGRTAPETEMLRVVTDALQS